MAISILRIDGSAYAPFIIIVVKNYVDNIFSQL